MRKAGSLPCPKSLILLVEQRGIEPLTSALRTRRSAKLSYCPTEDDPQITQIAQISQKLRRNLSDARRGTTDSKERHLVSGLICLL